MSVAPAPVTADKLAQQMAALAIMLGRSTDKNHACTSLQLSNWLKFKITDNKTHDSWNDLIWSCILKYEPSAFYDHSFCLEFIKTIQKTYTVVQMIVHKETGETL